MLGYKSLCNSLNLKKCSKSMTSSNLSSNVKYSTISSVHNLNQYWYRYSLLKNHPLARTTQCRRFRSSQPSQQNFQIGYRPKSVRMGWSSSVIRDLLPFTAEIITSKSRPLENIAVGYCLPSEPESSSLMQSDAESTNISIKSIDDSYLEIILPFADQPELRDSMMQCSQGSGQSMKGMIMYGKLFEILDALAADISYRHCDGNTDRVTIVTASIDGIRAYRGENGDIEIDLLRNDLKLRGYLTYVGTSSMEVTIDMVSVDVYGSEQLVGSTQFIMVARDPKTGKPAAVNKLLVTDETKDEFELGQKRSAARKSRAASSLATTPPAADEVQFMHKLYLDSKQMQAQRNVFQNVPASIVASMAQSSQTFSNYKWMRSTAFKTVLMMHRQNRNVHGKIFGGYILKVTYDAAYIAAACFFGEENPIFICVDEVQFVKPVNVGSIIELKTTVAYSRNTSIVVQVHASDVNYQTGMRTKTNILSFVFKKSPQTSQWPLDLDGSGMVGENPEVMPLTYDEFVTYLEGRRCMRKLAGEGQLLSAIDIE